MKNVEEGKEEKGEEIKGKAIRPFGAEEKSEEKSQWVRDTCWGKEQWAKRKRESFFFGSSCISM